MISPTDLFHPPPAPHFKTFQVFLIYCPIRKKKFKYVAENKAGSYQAKRIKNSEGNTEMEYRKTPWCLIYENTVFSLME